MMFRPVFGVKSNIQLGSSGNLLIRISKPGSESHPRTITEPPASAAWAVEHGFWLKKEGYKPSTIERRVRILRTLARYADLADPEAVKNAIARIDWSENLLWQ